MQVKMNEYFQGTGVRVKEVPSGIETELLQPGEVYDVGGDLGAWLVEHGKAEDVTPKPKPKPAVQPAPDEVQEIPAQKPGTQARRGRGRTKK